MNDKAIDALLKRSLGSSEHPAPEFIRNVKNKMVVAACLIIPVSVFAANDGALETAVASE